MYDKVKLVLRELPLSYNWHEILERTQEMVYWASGTGGAGKWRGRNIVVTNSYVSFEGSLPKSQYGHNIKNLKLKEVQRVIEELSEDLGVPMYDAEVENVEVANNFIMENPPVMYTDKLRSDRWFVTNKWNDTLYMDKIGCVRLKFYDKIKEAKEKDELPMNRGDLPENLLRYEVTFKKKELKRIFKRPLTAEELWDKNVFMTFVVEWFGYYDDLIKLTGACMNIDFSIFKSADDYVNWCICTLNEGQNQPDYIKRVLFKNRPTPKGEDRKLHGQIQKKITKALEWGKTHLPDSCLMSELNTKIENYVNWLIEQSEDGMSKEEFDRFIKQMEADLYPKSPK